MLTTKFSKHLCLASQRLQECAKICVKKCKRAKNWKIDFADVCIFFFWRQSYLQFLPILRPSSVPRSHFGYPKTKAFILIIIHLYLQILHSVSESRFCVGKWYETTLYQFVITCTYFKFVILSVWWWLCDKRARRTCFGRVPRRWCESHRLQKLLACPL